MGKVHERLQELGRQGALAFATTVVDRRALDAASEYLTDEDTSTGFLFSGWCQTGLPHKALGDDDVWRVDTDRVNLMIEPGSVTTPNGGTRRVGVPYGSRARLILLYLQSEAIRTNSPEIELGHSLRAWLGKLGVPVGGKSMQAVRDQALRISRCRMTFQISKGGAIGFTAQNLVDTAMFANDTDGQLLDTVKLGDGFFRELKKHPVPLEEAALRALSNNSQALDIYCWLAYRLHALKGLTTITWAGLQPQFGSSYTDKVAFRRRFIEGLTMAMAVYPEAKVEVVRGGIILEKSPPPVKKVLVA
jgi:hypothetical protein